MGYPAPLKSRSRIKLPEPELTEEQAKAQKKYKSGFMEKVPFPELMTKEDLKVLASGNGEND